jgi:hypothetical protein
MDRLAGVPSLLWRARSLIRPPYGLLDTASWHPSQIPTGGIAFDAIVRNSWCLILTAVQVSVECTTTPLTTTCSGVASCSFTGQIKESRISSPIGSTLLDSKLTSELDTVNVRPVPLSGAVPLAARNDQRISS